MKKNERAALFKLLGGLGLILILVGAMTDLYDVKYGVLAAVGLWILIGAVASYYGEDKKRSRRRR